MNGLVVAEVSQNVVVSWPPPRAAYIHVPFCRHRCGYCNFTLIAGRDDLIDSYLRAIDLELSGCLALAASHEIDTLYLGGGTPTHLSPVQFRQLSASVLRTFRLARGYEWTVEANPADVDETMIETLAALGVNRLSLGVQSFRKEKLRLLERDHSRGDIERAAKLARRAGLRMSLDLMFAAPGETLAQWAAEIESAIQLGPDHVSTYGLTFERGSAFWGRRLRGELAQLDEELERDMYALAIEELAAGGFVQYEVANFAKPGQRSRHNETYWSGNGYFAAGPGAARYVDGVREMNHRSTTTYIRRLLAGRSPVAERECLDDRARAKELLIFGLRRIQGVRRTEFAAQDGL